jgi:hypothetical protein
MCQEWEPGTCNAPFSEFPASLFTSGDKVHKLSLTCSQENSQKLLGIPIYYSNYLKPGSLFMKVLGTQMWS